MSLEAFNQAARTAVKARGCKTIYKYEVVLEEVFTISMPRCAFLLSVQLQNGKPAMWAVVDPAAPTEERRFGCFGTGNPLPDGFGGTFVGTVILPVGMVVHVFELPE